MTFPGTESSYPRPPQSFKHSGVETTGRTQDGDGNESNSGDGNGDEDGNGSGNEDRIGECGGEANKRKKLHKTYKRHVGDGEDLGGKRKNVEKKGLVQ